MVGIVFSTEAEATPFLARYAGGRLEGVTEGEFAFDSDLLVSILGIGKIKATLRVERLLQEHRLSRIVHVGACWSFGDEPGVDEIIAIEQAFEGDRIELSAPSYPRMPIDTEFRQLKSYRIVTQDHTPGGAEEVGYWQRLAHVTDYTAYPLAYVAATHGVRCDIVKIVLGRAGAVVTPGGERVSKAHEALAAFVLSAMPAILSAG
jgi:hypothetical protein